MKKALCLLFALLLILSGCGERGGGTPDDSSAVTPQIADSAENNKSENRIPDFTTTDLEGSTVTQDIFLDKDLTVVNVWGTYCPPCINEMPELGAWAEEMPDNVQLLGVVCDVMTGEEGETLELARDIVAKTGAGYTSITMCDGLAWITYGIGGVPTTFFVDGNGEIVGKAILGAYVDQYKAQVEALLHENEG